MMGVTGILGGALLSAIHGATVINTIYQDGGAYTTFLSQKKLIQCLQLIVSGHIVSRYLDIFHWYYWISI